MNGMKTGSPALMPRSAQDDHVADLVDEDQQHEADGEGPAEHPGVGDDRDAHRDRDAEELQLGQQQEDLELPQSGEAGTDAAR